MKEKIRQTNNDEVFLEEEDYMEKMTHIVSPLLSANRRTGFVEGYNRAKIYYEYYIHPQAKAVVVISHGYCEFTAKFEEVIFYFYQAGYSVYIPDHRGHGYSVREIDDKCKVYVHSYEEYVLDFHSLITKVILEENRYKPLILYAHSMGGAIGALYLEQYPEIFTCAILTSPMLEIDSGIIPKPIVWLITTIKKLTGTDQDYVTRHRAFDGKPDFEGSSCLSKARYRHIFSKRLQEEHYQTWGATSAWTLASIKAVQKLQKQAKLVKTPVLLFQAGRDTTVKPGGQRRFAAKTINTQMVVMPASKHEIYNADTETRREYYQRIFEYLKEQITFTGRIE